MLLVVSGKLKLHLMMVQNWFIPITLFLPLLSSAQWVNTPHEDRRVGEKILKINFHNMMYSVRRKTHDALVAPLVYVMNHPKEFIFDDVRTAKPKKELQPHVKAFRDYKNFVKSIAPRNLSSSRKISHGFSEDGRLSSHKSTKSVIASPNGHIVRRPIKSKFSGKTVCDAVAEKLPSVQKPNAFIEKKPSGSKQNSKFKHYRRGVTLNMVTDNNLTGFKLKRSGQDTKKKSKLVSKLDDLSDSVSSDGE